MASKSGPLVWMCWNSRYVSRGVRVLVSSGLNKRIELSILLLKIVSLIYSKLVVNVVETFSPTSNLHLSFHGVHSKSLPVLDSLGSSPTSIEIDHRRTGAKYCEFGFTLSNFGGIHLSMDHVP